MINFYKKKFIKELTQLPSRKESKQNLCIALL